MLYSKNVRFIVLSSLLPTMCALEEKLKVDGIMSPDYKRFVDDTLDLAADLHQLKPSINYIE